MAAEGGAGVVEVYIAMYEYVPQEPGELSFLENDRIEIIVPDPENCWPKVVREYASSNFQREKM